MENLGNMLGTHWELDRNTVRTWWEQQKSKKSNTPSPFKIQKKNWAPWVHAGSPHWLPKRISMPTWVLYQFLA
jgi:hypothetical protein